MAEPPVGFAHTLRRLRASAGLTQEDLAEAAGLSSRTLSDLERGVVAMPRRDTVRQLAVALGLDAMARVEFEAAARGRSQASGATTAMRTLPRDIASFTGRRRELRRIEDAATAVEGSASAVAIHAIGGTAGVGKTAFAVHAAHRLADRFPGGQIFLPLHAHTPGRRPVDPADALASLLLIIGMPAAQIPTGLEERAALWRDRAAARLLLVLDDATGTEQVQPLLPGGGASLVLVTSRRRLTALEDAITISLDTLPADDAGSLLVGLASRPWLSPDEPTVAEITRLCGYLPLALGMVARQLYRHPSWTAAGHAASLAAAVDRLGLLTAENVSVTAALDQSYTALPESQQRLFRRLGLHPGAETDAYSAAALDGTDVATARRSLERLYDQHLLTEPSPGRYRMHDLIREHARARAGRADSDDDRRQAVDRVLDFYQHGSAHARTLRSGQAPGTGADTPEPAPTAILLLRDRDQALAWLRAERASLLACLEQVTAAGQDARIVALTAGIEELLRLDGPWADAIDFHAAAVAAAQRLGDPADQAAALTALGQVEQLTGDYPAAARHLREALAVCEDLGVQLGRLSALQNLAIVRRVTGDYHGAARDLEAALDISREIGSRQSQACILAYLGDVRRAAGNLSAAAQCLQQALRISRDLGIRQGEALALTFRGQMARLTGDVAAARRDVEQALKILHDIGDRGGQAAALNEAGSLRTAVGDLDQARLCHQRALGVARRLGSPLEEARALAGLGRCSGQEGNCIQASDLLRHAWKILQRIGAAETAEVCAELGGLCNAPTYTAP
jgi:tetratricopeptide (TPR) repeat protein/transcriptional regulator with XRE-family HTH domain